VIVFWVMPNPIVQPVRRTTSGPIVNIVWHPVRVKDMVCVTPTETVSVSPVTMALIVVPVLPTTILTLSAVIVTPPRAMEGVCVAIRVGVSVMILTPVQIVPNARRAIMIGLLVEFVVPSTPVRDMVPVTIKVFVRVTANSRDLHVILVPRIIGAIQSASSVILLRVVMASVWAMELVPALPILQAHTVKLVRLGGMDPYAILLVMLPTVTVVIVMSTECVCVRLVGRVPNVMHARMIIMGLSVPTVWLRPLVIITVPVVNMENAFVMRLTAQNPIVRNVILSRVMYRLVTDDVDSVAMVLAQGTECVWRVCVSVLPTEMAMSVKYVPLGTTVPFVNNVRVR